MPVEFKKQRRTLTACLIGEIDHHTAETIRERIDERIRTERPETLCIRFRDVTFMDSSGVGLVMGRYRLLSAYGGKLELADMSRSVERIMRLSGIEKIASVV